MGLTGQRSGVRVRDTEAFVARYNDERKPCASEGHALSAAIAWCEQAAKERTERTVHVEAPDGTMIYVVKSDGSGLVTVGEV